MFGNFIQTAYKNFDAGLTRAVMQSPGGSSQRITPDEKVRLFLLALSVRNPVIAGHKYSQWLRNHKDGNHWVSLMPATHTA